MLASIFPRGSITPNESREWARRSPDISFSSRIDFLYAYKKLNSLLKQKWNYRSFKFCCPKRTFRGVSNDHGPLYNNLESYYISAKSQNLKMLRNSTIKLITYLPLYFKISIHLVSLVYESRTVTQTFYRRPPIFLVWDNLLSLLFIIIFIHLFIYHYYF